MELHNLPKIIEKRSKRLGRGHGSGRGKTAGRGTKGQHARGDISLFFEGGALPLIKRLPFLRGRGRNKVFKDRKFTVNISELNKLPSKSVVDIDALIRHSLVPKLAKKYGVKILGNGKLEKPLTVKVITSEQAKKVIERAGGEISP